MSGQHQIENDRVELLAARPAPSRAGPSLAHTQPCPASENPLRKALPINGIVFDDQQFHGLLSFPRAVAILEPGSARTELNYTA